LTYGGYNLVTAVSAGAPAERRLGGWTMDAARYPAWWQLHLRAARGERLSPEEQAAYEAGARELDETETMPGALSRLRQARAAIAQAEAECVDLRRQRDALDAEMAALEARLSRQTRQALGVAD
jgi:hypothetical protein